MAIEVTFWAETAEAALDFLEAVAVARRPTAEEIAQGHPAHIPVPIADVLVDGFRDPIHVMRPTGNMIDDGMGNEVPEMEPVPGWHGNLRFYDPPDRPGSATTLTKPTPTEGWPDDADLFDRTYILELVAGRTGEIPNWVASADDPIPPGYVAGQCRAYDPALIANRRRIWA